MKTLNALYVWRLARELGDKLKGLSFSRIFSLDKKHLCLNLVDKNHNLIQFSFKILGDESLFFKEEIPREANKNAQNHFDEALNLPILSVEPHVGERSFLLNLGNAQLVFFLHGRNAFVALEHNGGVEVFPSEIKTERYAQLMASMITVDLNEIASNQELRSKTFMKHLRPVWDEHPELDAKSFVQRYLSGSVFINRLVDGFELQAFEQGNPISSHSNILTALTEYAQNGIGEWYFDALRKQLESVYLKDLAAIDKRLKALYHRLDELQTKGMYRHWADLLLSNLTIIQAGVSEVEVLDYVSNQQISIPLQSQLSIQENIERYYRKSKNQVQETNRLEQEIQLAEEKKSGIEASLKKIADATHIKELRVWQKEGKKSKVELKRVPYHEFTIQGFVVLVGKQAKDNDELTLKIAKKDDLWLHARDVSGSHVVIRKKSGVNVPDAVIEQAAGLALWFSKRKNEHLAPVIVTEKKYVRKKKGAAAGAVIVEKERVIMVEPKAP